MENLRKQKNGPFISPDNEGTYVWQFGIISAQWHYVRIMPTQITGDSTLYLICCLGLGQINHKSSPITEPLLGISTDDWLFPGSNAESVSACHSFMRDKNDSGLGNCNELINDV